jgi:hypothetical protein
MFGFGQTTLAETMLSQQTSGNCSPAIIAQGDVSVECGISAKVLTRLQKEVNEQAEHLFSRSLVILEKTLGKDHADTKRVRENYELFLTEKAARK